MTGQATPMNTYVVGTEITLDASFADSEGTPTDPTEVTASILLPDETVEELEPVKISDGVYEVSFTPTMVGLHQYRYAGTGTINAAGESFFLAQTVFPTEE